VRGPGITSGAQPARTRTAHAPRGTHATIVRCRAGRGDRAPARPGDSRAGAMVEVARSVPPEGHVSPIHPVEPPRRPGREWHAACHLARTTGSCAYNVGYPLSRRGKREVARSVPPRERRAAPLSPGIREGWRTGCAAARRSRPSRDPRAPGGTAPGVTVQTSGGSPGRGAYKQGSVLDRTARSSLGCGRAAIARTVNGQWRTVHRPAMVRSELCRGGTQRATPAASSTVPPRPPLLDHCSP